MIRLFGSRVEFKKKIYLVFMMTKIVMDVVDVTKIHYYHKFPRDSDNYISMCGHKVLQNLEKEGWHKVNEKKICDICSFAIWKTTGKDGWEIRREALGK